MGESLYLHLPEKSDKKEILHNYYEYKLGKKSQITGEDQPSVENYNIYQRKLKKLEENDELWVSEKLGSIICKSIDMEGVYEIFEILENEGLRSTIIYGEEIEQLIQILRSGKPELRRRKPIADWELTLEGNQVALCEFALENELGIGLDI